MVRRMKAIIRQIESVVTPSGNSGHVVVPKDWIGKRRRNNSENMK
jgi:putative transposon-encoded protein